MSLHTKLLRVKEAAQLLNIGVWTVRDLAKRGLIPYIQNAPYGPFLFSPEDLDAYIANHKVVVTTPVLASPAPARESLGGNSTLLPHVVSSPERAEKRHEASVTENPNRNFGFEAAQPTQNRSAAVKRSHGKGFVYSRKGSPYLWIGYYRAGKLVRESSGTTNRQEADDLLRHRIAMVVNKTINTLETKIDDLYQLVKQDYQLKKRASIQDLVERWTKHLQPFFGGLYAHQITGELIAAYQEKRQKQNAADATINRETSIIRRGYTLGLKNKRVLHDHVPYFEKLEEDNTREGFVEFAQYQKLSDACAKRGVWLRALFEAGFTWGWRLGELTNLRVKQVEFANNTVRLEPGTTKNKRGRTVKMTSNINVLFSALANGKKPEEFIFTRENGERVLDFRAAWDACCKEAGCLDLLFHDLRRTAIRNMVRAGIPEKQAMMISGHLTRSMFDRYDIVNEKDAAANIQKLEQYQNVSKKSAATELAQNAHNPECEENEQTEVEAAKLLN